MSAALTGLHEQITALRQQAPRDDGVAGKLASLETVLGNVDSRVKEAERKIARLAGAGVPEGPVLPPPPPEPLEAVPETEPGPPQPPAAPQPLLPAVSEPAARAQPGVSLAEVTQEVPPEPVLATGGESAQPAVVHEPRVFPPETVAEQLAGEPGPSPVIGPAAPELRDTQPLPSRLLSLAEPWWFEALDRAARAPVTDLAESPEAYADRIRHACQELAKDAGNAGIVRVPSPIDNRFELKKIVVGQRLAGIRDDMGPLQGRELFQLFVAVESGDSKSVFLFVPLGPLCTSFHPYALPHLVESPPEVVIDVRSVIRPAQLALCEDGRYEVKLQMKVEKRLANG